VASDAFQWYPWYPKDYRASRAVQRMSYVERGLYRELLDEVSIEGFIPSAIDELADICGTPVEIMLDAWPRLMRSFYEIEPGKLSNARMDEVLVGREEHRIKSSLGGKNSAAVRALKRASSTPEKDASVNGQPSSGLEGDLKGASSRTDRQDRQSDKESAPTDETSARAGGQSSASVRAEGLLPIPLVSGVYLPTDHDLATWTAAFPGVSVRQQLLKIAAHWDANPTKRKTGKGIRKSIVSWLTHEQDGRSMSGSWGRNQPNPSPRRLQAVNQ
jgi:hypothetical protein